MAVRARSAGPWRGIARDQADTAGGIVEVIKHVCERGLAASLIAFGIGLAVVPTASADPNDAEQTDTPVPGMVTVPAPNLDNVNPAAAVACKQFATTLNFAATTSLEARRRRHRRYRGPSRLQGDPTVRNSNVTARPRCGSGGRGHDRGGDTGSAARDRRADAGMVSGRDEAPVDHGLRRGGDTLDNVATELNNDAYNARHAPPQERTLQYSLVVVRGVRNSWNDWVSVHVWGEEHLAEAAASSNIGR